MFAAAVRHRPQRLEPLGDRRRTDDGTGPYPAHQFVRADQSLVLICGSSHIVVANARYTARSARVRYRLSIAEQFESITQLYNCRGTGNCQPRGGVHVRRKDKESNSGAARTGSQLRARALGLVVTICATYPVPSYAYLDPGTGSIILQSLLATIAVAFGVLRLYWQRFKAFFLPSSRSSRNDDASEKESAANPDT